MSTKRCYGIAMPRFGASPDARFRARAEFREIVKGRGFSLAGLARAMGYSRFYVGHVARGDVRINRDLMEKIAKTVGIGPTKLFVEAGVDGRREKRERQRREADARLSARGD